MRKWLPLLAAVWLIGCSAQPDDPRPTVAVTTSYLECALRDIAGDEFRVASLLPPGSCPGHFDVSPSMLDTLAHAKLMLRFAFQASLDDKLHHFRDNGLTITAITSPEGLCLPSTYAVACRNVCEALAEAHPEGAERYRRRLAEVESRMDALTAEMRSEVERRGLAGARVLSSGHQSHFSRALGLEVVATFTGREAAGFKELERCLDAGRHSDIRFVIANLQEGVMLAEPVAHRLGAAMVVFSNFPMMQGDETTFDALVRRNLAALPSVAKGTAQ
jgi:zinc transport system substrate-binding protein